MGKEIKMIEFARDNNLNLTGSLTHNQVTRMARAWLPQVRFHEKELYHPISFRDYMEIPGRMYPTLTAEEKETFTVNIIVPDGTGYKTEGFEPGVMKNPGPRRVLEPGDTENPIYIGTSNVLASLDNILGELLNDDIGSGTEITQGNGDKGTRFFYGAKTTVTGQENATPNDPFLPAHDIKIIAEYKVLIDLLAYELLVEEEEDYPLKKDALRRGFSITSLFFFRPDGAIAILAESTRRNIMQGLITAHKAGNNAEFQNIINTIPAGWSFNTNNWRILTGYAFIEYHFCYGCSNWSDYQNDLFSNYHEGDLEGCCIVFEQAKVEAEFASPGADPLNVTPISIITSVHEEFQNLDKYKALDASHARQDLNVWISLGSHATYLSPGNHDVVDFGFLFDSAAERIPPYIFIPFFPVILAGLIIASIVEHFIDVEDQTSDEGGFTDSNEPDGSDNSHWQSTVRTTPLSLENNIYKNDDLDALAVRSYPGKYGGSSGLIDESSTFENKSGRYFRKLAKNLKVEDIIL